MGDEEGLEYGDSEIEHSDHYEHWEYSASFSGYCICAHDPEEHGWGSCGIEDEDGECPCYAGWEE